MGTGWGEVVSGPEGGPLGIRECLALESGANANVANNDGDRTRERIQEIRRRLQGASRGKWRLNKRQLEEMWDYEITNTANGKSLLELSNGFMKDPRKKPDKETRQVIRDVDFLTNVKDDVAFLLGLLEPGP